MRVGSYFDCNDIRTALAQMSDVFISYSRKDQGLVYKLHSALQATGREAWVNWQDTLPTKEWWQEIQRGIEGANAFVFVLSPDSVRSKLCQQEIAHAIHHHKRIIPIVYRDGFELNPNLPAHQDLKRHNWLLFTEASQFESMFQKLLEIMNTDLESVRTHTQLLVRSLEWDHNARNDNFLLRGDDLTAAEQWFLENNHSLPPTPQHEIYLQKSREVEEASQRVLQAGKQAKQLMRLGAAILGGAIAVATVVGLLAWRTEQKLETANRANRIDATNVNAMKQFDGAQLPALLTALREAKTLQEITPDAKTVEDYPTVSPIFALRSMLGQIREQNQVRTDLTSISAIAFSPDSKLIATGGKGKVQLWTIAGEPRAEFLVPQNRKIRALSFHPKGQEIFAVTEDSSLGRWDLTGKSLSWKPQKISVKQAQFSLDLQDFFTLRNDGMTQIWSITGTSKAILKKQPKTISFDSPQFANLRQSMGDRAEVSPKGQHLAISRQDGSLELWKLIQQEGQSIPVPKPMLQITHENRIDAMSFSPNSRYLATGGASRDLHLWNLADAMEAQNRLAESLPVNIPIQNSATSPDGTLIATGNEQGMIHLKDRQGREIRAFQAASGRILSVGFSPNGKQLLTGGTNGIARLWTLSGQQLGEWRGSKVAFSPNGQQIITVDSNGMSQVIENETLEQLLAKSCLWMRDYLTNNPTVMESDQRLCNLSAKP